MFQVDIEKIAKSNKYFRRVLYTGMNIQLVVMSLKPGEDIGEEIHEQTDQILFFVDGDGEAVIDGESSSVTKGDVVFVAAGTLHNFKNCGDEDLKLYTTYSPPEHAEGTIHKTKEDSRRVIPVDVLSS